LVVYAGINPESYGEVVDLIRAELHRVATEPIEAEEFRKAQEQLKGNLLLGLESTSSRMTRLAKMEIYFGRIYDLDEILKGIEAVTPARFQTLAQKLFSDGRYALSSIGPIPQKETISP